MIEFVIVREGAYVEFHAQPPGARPEVVTELWRAAQLCGLDVPTLAAGDRYRLTLERL